MDEDPRDYVVAALDRLFAQARAQFGDAVKSYWFDDGDACPGCGFPIDLVKYRGHDALSVNAFIYRSRGVLIGYLLCGRCAQQIFEAAERAPYTQTPLHAVIEQNLIRNYGRYLASLDA